MKKSIKILALLLVLVMMVACFAGCAKDPVETKPATKPATKPTTKPTTAAPTTTTAPKDYKDVDFQVWWWGGEPRNTNTAAALKEFDKKYTNLETKVSFAGWGDYWTAIDMAVAGNTLPDVMQQDFATIYTYASAGKLMKLDDLVASGRIDMSSVSESNMDLCRFYDGSIYAISTGANTWTFSYRKDIIEEAGVTLPEDKIFSLEEFVEIAKKVFDETGSQAYYTNTEYMWGSGLDYFTEDGTEPGFDAEFWADWLKFQAEACNYGWMTDGEDGLENTEMAFQQGVLWCVPKYSNNIPNDAENCDCEIGWFANPYVGDSLDDVAFTSHAKPTMYWAISANTQNLDLAVDCVNFLLKSDEYFEICGLDRGMPIFGDVVEMLEPTMTEKDLLAAEIISVQQEIGNLGHPPYNAEYASQAKSLLNDSYWENQWPETRPADDAARLERAEQLIEDMLYVLGGGEI